MVRRFKRVVAAAAFALLGGSVSAGTVDFNDRDAFAGGGESLLSGGYSFLAVSQGALSFLQVDAQPDIVGDGSRRLLAGNRTEISMTRLGGGGFDLLGLCFGGSWTDPAKRGRWADAIEIIGHTSAGSFVSQQFDLSAAPASLQTVLLSGFVDLDSVHFRPLRFDSTTGADFEFVLDNLQVASIPEPETWALLAAGLGLLALRARRRS